MLNPKKLLLIALIKVRMYFSISGCRWCWLHAGLVARHNAHCLVLTADRSKIRPFKSMVKLLHTRNFKQPL